MNNILNVTINNKDDYINKFNSDRISIELNNYILEECKSINIKEKLKIVIDSKFKLEKEEQNKIDNMLRQNYKDDITELSALSEKLMVTDTIMFFLGVLFLLIYFLNTRIIVMSEVILIIGWVLIWESIYNFIFARIENKMKIKRRKQLVTSEIIFK